MDEEEKIFQDKWNKLLKVLEKDFGGDLDVDSIVYLIGIQELGKGPDKYSKAQKMDIMHVGVCALLSQFGYYIFVGEDEDGWPHFDLVENMPELKPMQQHRLMKEAIVMYFENLGIQK